jgi:hypothetical protein
VAAEADLLRVINVLVVEDQDGVVIEQPDDFRHIGTADASGDVDTVHCSSKRCCEWGESDGHRVSFPLLL